ncbi:hypothetical protein [Streptomyces sp. NPDC090025]|uniref:hypothetical protein n=1 Tax=Streptomyces sp. NPDC090025 TaxID=3365922 RepID=UPI003835EE17
MRVTLDDGWTATVTDDPLPLAPRFTAARAVDVGPYTDRAARDRFLSATFGSGHFLWDTPDILRFDQETRRLVGFEFQLPYTSSYAETADRLPPLPPLRPGGLRADEVRDGRLEMCPVLCRAPGDAALICLRDADVLDAPPDARIGIAPDVSLLLRGGAVVGWTLTDPARHLTPDLDPAAPAEPAGSTRALLTESLDLVTGPLLDAVVDGDPAALARLRTLDEALRADRDDPARAAALLALVGDLAEDHGDWRGEDG